MNTTIDEAGQPVLLGGSSFAAGPKNHYVESVVINLTKWELRALSYFERRHGFDLKVNDAKIVQYILLLVLNHPRVLDEWTDSVFLYCKAEGLDQHDHMRGCLKARSEYRYVRKRSSRKK